MVYWILLTIGIVCLSIGLIVIIVHTSSRNRMNTKEAKTSSQKEESSDESTFKVDDLVYFQDTGRRAEHCAYIKALHENGTYTIVYFEPYRFLLDGQGQSYLTREIKDVDAARIRKYTLLRVGDKVMVYDPTQGMSVFMDAVVTDVFVTIPSFMTRGVMRTIPIYRIKQDDGNIMEVPAVGVSVPIP